MISICIYCRRQYKGTHGRFTHGHCPACAAAKDECLKAGWYPPTSELLVMTGQPHNVDYRFRGAQHGPACQRWR